MHSSKNDVLEVSSGRRLTVRVTKNGEAERLLEFHAGADGVRVIGSAPGSDVVLRDAGVLPMHCYFERERDEIWLSAAQDSAAIRVNYQPVVGRVKLGTRCILEVGEARMQVIVRDEDENGPRHGLFGTEVIELGERQAATDLFETTPIDISVARGDLPTKSWQRMDAEDALNIVARARRAAASAATQEYPPPAPASVFTDTLSIPRPIVAPSPVELEAPTTTVRIPRPVPTVSHTEPIQPVLASPCIVVGAQNRLVLMPVIAPPRPRSGSDGDRAMAKSDVSAGSPPKGFPRHAASSPPTAAVGSQWRTPVPLPMRLGVDPGIFTTVGQPIAERLVAAEPPAIGKSRARAHLRRLALLRRQFATGLGREPKVVAVIALCAALALGALVAQTVRAWREVAAVPVVTGSSSPARAPAARSALPPKDDASRASTAVAPVSSAAAAQADDAGSTSAADPLVDQAVGHLLSGRQADAAEAYASLAARYPSAPVYAATAKILRRRLNPACRGGTENECGKASQ